MQGRKQEKTGGVALFSPAQPEPAKTGSWPMATLRIFSSRERSRWVRIVRRYCPNVIFRIVYITMTSTACAIMVAYKLWVRNHIILHTIPSQRAIQCKC
jgi:hypothetical protein